MSLVLPVNISLMTWVEALIHEYPDLPQLNDETQWKRWATEVISFSEFSNDNVPHPDNFLDWREWAAMFTNLIS